VSSVRVIYPPQKDERSASSELLGEVDVLPEDEQGSAEVDTAGTGEVGESSMADNEPDSDVGGDRIAEKLDLASILERFTGELAELRAEFAAKIRYDEVKERQIASMHEELQSFREGLHLRLLQPVFTDLIAMHDDLVDVLGAGNPAPELVSFKESVLETLARNGVSSYSVDSHEVDRGRQRVIRVVTTSDEKLDRHVQDRLRVGFEYDTGKVLRPEWVIVYRHAPKAEESDVALTRGGE
jgi:molecular chaperone GrpE (heat shock protein)